MLFWPYFPAVADARDRDVLAFQRIGCGRDAQRVQPGTGDIDAQGCSMACQHLGEECGFHVTLGSPMYIRHYANRILEFTSASNLEPIVSSILHFL